VKGDARFGRIIGSVGRDIEQTRHQLIPIRLQFPQ
jgi:hypothetical protein